MLKYTIIHNIMRAAVHITSRIPCQWINQGGQIVRELNREQQAMVESPAFKVALGLYQTAQSKNHQTASRRLMELNRMIEQLANKFDELHLPSISNGPS